MGLRVGFRVTTASRPAATLLRKPEQLSLCSGKRESECKKLRAERVRPTSARGVLSKQKHVNKQGATPGEPGCDSRRALYGRSSVGVPPALLCT